MCIGMCLLLGYFFIVVIVVWFVLLIFVQEVKLGVCWVIEGIFNDIVILLVVLVCEDLLVVNLQQGRLVQVFYQFNQQLFNVNIGGIKKVCNEYCVYLIDVWGKVVFDFSGQVIGQDYLCWNDVWFILCGQYGVCSMCSDLYDEVSLVMYIVVLVMDKGWIIGVLSVGKFNLVMMLVIKCSEWWIFWVGGVLLGIVLLIGGGVVWWINFFIGKLVCYVDLVIVECLLLLLEVGSSELCKLVQVLESMWVKFEGKNVIENYVYDLIYELKSLLVVICGVVEILCEGLLFEVVVWFIDNIFV